MSVSTTQGSLVYDANGNIIQIVAANEDSVPLNNVIAPLTSAAVNPNVAPTGVSNVPLNAKSVPVANLQIGSSTGQSLASWSNPS